MAQTTNGLSNAEIQGRALAREIISRRPTENTINKGMLQIRDGNGNRSEVPIICRNVVTISVANTNVMIPNWQTLYQATLTNKTNYLRVMHTTSLTNIYSYSTNANAGTLMVGDLPVVGYFFRNHQVSGSALMTPFAGSDFCIADLGLEFLHWPDQKVLPHTTELKRGRAYTLLQSTNPNPGANGYSRVLSWIDKETDGILEAKAYDAQGNLLKEFYPKDFKKVDGQWEVQSMEMDNDQTGSRSVIKFDLKK